MATTASHSITVGEFQKLPEDTGPVYHELRNGEVVAVTRPRYKHFSIQRRLRRLLENLTTEGVVDTEFAFRPSPEHEISVADVAYVTAERERLIDPEGYLEGAPDLVIEVLSPSNTASEIDYRDKLTLPRKRSKGVLGGGFLRRCENNGSKRIRLRHLTFWNVSL